MSGGFSSWIAGGKCIDGFKQGLITSGLNHAAHAFVEGGPGDPPEKSNKVSVSDLHSRIDDYDGFWGKLEYIWDGGVKDGVKYDINGNPNGFAPIIGTPPDIGGPAKGAKWLSHMLKNKNYLSHGVKKVGDFWEYTVKVANSNGNGFTLWKKYVNSSGNMIKHNLET